MSSSTENALKKAGESLDKALKNIREGKPELREEPAPVKAVALTEDDPDALAEAFFAQQALQKQRETRLDVEDWAKVISKIEIRKETSTELPIEVREHRDALKKALVQHLCGEFQKAWEEAP